ncbi:MAG: CBS domain-containing protein [Acidimicrobiaceae bacterium]|nr:CBS domain-containing protein [Acidimicrobiaceae bacterium]
MSQCHDTYEGPGLGHADLPVRVRGLMTPNPVTIEPTATVKDIAETLLKHDIRSVPVVDIGDRMVGIVGEADLVCRDDQPTVRHHHLGHLLDEAPAGLRHRCPPPADGLTAGEIMTTDVITCTPDELVTTVARRMLHREVRALPVVEDGRLVGMLSRHDVMRLFDRPDTEIRSRLAELLADPLLAPAGHSVEVHVRDGVVILTGAVRGGGDARTIGILAREVPGVVDVIDRTHT